MAQTTVQIPVETLEKIAALGKAMLSLAQELQRQSGQASMPVSIPIPDLTRPETIPDEDKWFWSEEWQAGERKVNEDLKAGRYKTFNSVEELIAALN